MSSPEAGGFDIPQYGQKRLEQEISLELGNAGRDEILHWNSDITLFVAARHESWAELLVLDREKGAFYRLIAMLPQDDSKAWKGTHINRPERDEAERFYLSVKKRAGDESSSDTLPAITEAFKALLIEDRDMLVGDQHNLNAQIHALNRKIDLLDEDEPALLAA